LSRASTSGYKIKCAPAIPDPISGAGNTSRSWLSEGAQGSANKVIEDQGFNIRDRILCFERMAASAVVPNPNNPRVHNQAQRAVLRDLLQQVGMADVLLVRENGDSKYVLIDGHLRREFFGKNELVPVVVLDLNAEEADLVTLTLGSSAAMAEWNQSLCAVLMQTVSTLSAAIDGLLQRVLGEAARQSFEPRTVEQDGCRSSALPSCS
jgi:hypothetical protein